GTFAKKRFANEAAVAQALQELDAGSGQSANERDAAKIAETLPPVTPREAAIDAGVTDATDMDLPSNRIDGSEQVAMPRKRRPDAGNVAETIEPAPTLRKFTLKLTPRGSEYRVGNADWVALNSG